MQATSLHQGWRPLRVRVVGYDGARALEFATPSGHSSMQLAPSRWRFSGDELAVGIGDVVPL